MTVPALHFRPRDNGAMVFRVETENRQQRLELRQLATLNIRSGEIKPQGQQQPSEDELAAMRDWIETRRAQLAARDEDEMARLVDALGAAAQWMQARASDEQVATHADPLLMAMHDLRAMILRRQIDAAGD
ncbi:hypothetical protein [Roseobacter sp. HKCCA0434]|uniref:hypothetical protein n=1 Tax=Roseobacter sp. HKCCA0434 TaxID=3079297 RepID=UPI002905A991|nr:hypothetical protein [Roseobacter sp. HKCCA0434]